MKNMIGYNASSINTGTIIVAVIIVGIIVWAMNKNRLQYNAEEVVISRDDRGRIAGMKVHRSAQ